MPYNEKDGNPTEINALAAQTPQMTGEKVSYRREPIGGEPEISSLVKRFIFL